MDEITGDFSKGKEADWGHEFRKFLANYYLDTLHRVITIRVITEKEGLYLVSPHEEVTEALHQVFFGGPYGTNILAYGGFFNITHSIQMLVPDRQHIKGRWQDLRHHLDNSFKKVITRHTHSLRRAVTEAITRNVHHRTGLPIKSLLGILPGEKVKDWVCPLRLLPPEILGQIGNFIDTDFSHFQRNYPGFLECSPSINNFQNAWEQQQKISDLKFRWHSILHN